jgi:DMSO/TMAO reductase YedYZ heme-binding membrane subunit
MSKANLKYVFSHYLLATLFTTIPFAILSFYIFYRRGYYDLYIINKALAGTSAVILGVVLLIGPLSRFFTVFARFLLYRKELGIIAFFLALSHGVVAMFFLPSKFPLAGYIQKTNWPFIYGLTGLLVLILLFFISNTFATNMLGRKRWWWLQNWGVRVGFILVALHVFVMKWKGWLNWYKTGGEKYLVHPEWPGAGLLVGWFIFFVLFVRLAEFTSPKLGKIAWYISLALLPAIYIVTFWWGNRN